MMEEMNFKTKFFFQDFMLQLSNIPILQAKCIEEIDL